MMASKPKRNYLTLKKKVEVIKVSEKNRGMSLRELGQQFVEKPRLPRFLRPKNLYSLCMSLMLQVAGCLLMVDNACMMMLTNHSMNGIPLLVLKISFQWVLS